MSKRYKLQNLIYQTATREFATQLMRLGYSSGSCKMLPNCLKEFLYKLEEKEIHSLQAIQPRHIQEHYQYLTQRPNRINPGALSSMMITHHIYSIRLFLNYLEQIGTLKENPISNLTFPRPQSKPRTILSIEEIKQLYEAATTLRERAMLSLFYGCGLRRTEAVKLNSKDVNYKTGLLYVREGKGKKRRAIPMSNQVRDDLKNYYQLERKTYITKATATHYEAFILSNAGTRMTGDGHNKKLKELLKKSEIKKDICLHSLRHSIATHLLENGLLLESVRDFLGHNHIDATQIYTRISRKQLQAL